MASELLVSCLGFQQQWLTRIRCQLASHSGHCEGRSHEALTMAFMLSNWLRIASECFFADRTRFGFMASCVDILLSVQFFS